MLHGHMSLGNLSPELFIESLVCAPNFRPLVPSHLGKIRWGLLCRTAAGARVLHCKSKVNSKSFGLSLEFDNKKTYKQNNPLIRRNNSTTTPLGIRVKFYFPRGKCCMDIWGDFLSRDIILQKMTKLGFCNRDNFLPCKKIFMKFFVHIIWEL